jgi:AMP phosphorylase
LQVTITSVASFVHRYIKVSVAIVAFKVYRKVDQYRALYVCMEMTVRLLDLDAGGKTIVVLNHEDAEELGVHSLDRVILETGGNSITAVVNTSEKFVPPGQVAVFDEVREELDLHAGQVVEVQARGTLKSKKYIRHKIDGAELTSDEIREIIHDVVERNLNDLELASFVTAIHLRGLSVSESSSLIEAMVETGSTLSFGETVCDKHSIGGIPGDKTSLLAVPVVAAAGLTIPKTSSRAITSPSGTADRAEMLMPVELELSDIKRIVGKTGGCLVWGGALDLAPADDLLIQIEQPLGIDPLLLSSIVSKKKSAGATHVVIDIPTGSQAKMKSTEEAHRLEEQFVHIGSTLGMTIECALTFGEQPLGMCIGPALEAREALRTLIEKGRSDLTEKVASLCGILFTMVGKTKDYRYGKALAEEILEKKAEGKLREIIEAQGGNPHVAPEDIPVGEHSCVVCSEQKGVVRWVNNRGLARVASAAGCPKDKGAGITLFKKLGDTVYPEEPLLEIISEKSFKLTQAVLTAQECILLGITESWEHMVVDT